jgi:hypothetical protein
MRRMYSCALLSAYVLLDRTRMTRQLFRRGTASTFLPAMALVSFLAALAIPPNLSAVLSSDDRPVLVLDLRQFGYQEPNGQRLLWAYQSIRNALTFLDNHTITISSFSKNIEPGLSVRGEKLGGDYVFETVFVNVESGKALRSRHWCNSGVGRGLFVVPNGNLVVWCDLELQLYGADSTLLKVLALNSKKVSRTPNVKQSPSGNTLFVIEADRFGEHVLCVRTTDLETVANLDLPGYFTDAASDSYFAFLRAHPDAGYSPPMDVFIRAISGRDSIAPKRIFTTGKPGCGSLVFVDDSLLSVSGGCPEVTMLSSSGEIRYRHRFDNVLTGPTTPCRGCDLFLFPTYTQSSGSAFPDKFPSTKTRSLMLLNRKTLDLRDWRGLDRAKQPPIGSLAFSPDGCALALQRGSQLELYRICNSPE